MFRRVLLTLAFVVALGVAGLGFSSKAEAHGCHRGHGGGYYGAYYPAPYHYGHRPRYRAYYYSEPSCYGPGYGYYGGPRYYGGSGVSFSVGF